MVDRVRALVMESPASGGSQIDYNPVEVDPKEDGLDGRAFFAQNGMSADSSAYLSRTGADLTLTDANAGTKRVQDLVSRVLGAVSSHSLLQELIHYLDEGPSEGYASGAVLRIVRSGALVTSKTWYASSSASAAPIVAVAMAYKAGTPLLASKTWTLYTPSGAVARTLVDTPSYSGILMTQVVRTWS